MATLKRLPLVPRLGSRVRFWDYKAVNGRTQRTLCEGTVIDRFEKPSLHSALCCVRLAGEKPGGQWMSARFVRIIARKV